MNALERIGIFFGLVFATPLFFYLCVKWGTIGFYNAKKYIEKQKKQNDNHG